MAATILSARSMCCRDNRDKSLQVNNMLKSLGIKLVITGIREESVERDFNVVLLTNFADMVGNT